MDFKEYKNIVEQFVPERELEEAAIWEMNQKRVRKTGKQMVKYAIVVCCLLIFVPSAVIAKETLFSSLKGDELGLSSVYEGSGVVSVHVENWSEKDLEFEPQIKLMQWTTGEEVEQISETVVFENTRFAAHSEGVMTIDLSQAYDIVELEKPLSEDWYYLILTNENFLFGQDWMCSVDFAKTEDIQELEYDNTVHMDEIAIQNIKEELQFYFEGTSWDPNARRELNAEYVKTYEMLLAGFEGDVISPVSPILPGNKISSEQPYFRVRATEFEAGHQWTVCDMNFKLLGRENEYALKISMGLPLTRYDAQADMPLFYIMSYKKEDIENRKNYVFLYGQLLTVEEMEQYKICEDEQFVFYEISRLLYTDLKFYAEGFVEHRGDVLFNEKIWKEIQEFYIYYKENLKDLIYYE